MSAASKHTNIRRKGAIGAKEWITLFGNARSQAGADIARATMNVGNAHQAHQRSALIVEEDTQQDTDNVVEL